MYETKNKLLFLNKNEGETNTFYYKKCEFLSKCKLNKKNMNDYLVLANIYANNTIYKCNYNETILKRISLIINS